MPAASVCCSSGCATLDVTSTRCLPIVLNRAFIYRTTQTLPGFILAVFVCLAAVFLLSLQARAFDSAQVLQHAQLEYGASAKRSVQRWFNLLDELKGLPESTQLERVNSFWNKSVQQAEDEKVWGQTDFWATPLDSLGKGRGDCEDFVIGKYFSLVQLGVKPEKLRFIYVRARVQGQQIAHMVLGYYSSSDAEPLILDSLVNTIAKASSRPDLTPVFSFNVQGIYVPGARPASVDRIGRWRSLLQRMQAQGLLP